ncbi:hypothetical protein ACFQ0B_14025 [Nonomuraea thailandensis]
MLVAEAAELGVPLRVVDLPGEPLSLVRPDQHVAWRGGDPAGALRTALAHDR